jgi:hypothetical protein
VGRVVKVDVSVEIEDVEEVARRCVWRRPGPVDRTLVSEAVNIRENLLSVQPSNLFKILSLGDNCPGVGRVVKVDVSVEIEDVEEVARLYTKIYNNEYRSRALWEEPRFSPPNCLYQSVGLKDSVEKT